MTHPLWSDGFRIEERAGRGPLMAEVVLGLVAGLVALGALGAEIVMSIAVTAKQLSTPSGNWVAGLLAIGLGAVGPYSAVLAWRAAAERGRPPYQRIATAAVAGIGMAAIAVAWLLLLRTFQHPIRLAP